MTIVFYEHPLSSYVQKAKTALYDKGILFESKMIDGSEPAAPTTTSARSAPSPRRTA
jgi:glutathione S-transferase